MRESARRGRLEREYELVDTGIFGEERYFDVTVEHAKASPDDILVAITIANRGPDVAPIVVLPTLWFRNTWTWGRSGEGYWKGASLAARAPRGAIAAEHPTLGHYRLALDAGPDGPPPELLFTENETNSVRLFDTPNAAAFVKDAFHDAIIEGRADAVNPARHGARRPRAPTTSRSRRAARRACACASPQRSRRSGRSDTVRRPSTTSSPAARAEADAFYAARTAALAPTTSAASCGRPTPACSGRSSSITTTCRPGSTAIRPALPRRPPAQNGRNSEWRHLDNRDVLSMPDKWEYPWYAAWDLAFHMLPFARIDPQFAKEQLVLLTREWYMHPNGQLPAYEWAFGDVNPPVHAWAAWRVYKITGPKGQRDRKFLARVFQKLLVNFTWWVNRKDVQGKHLFSGGFLGLDNIGVFDRSRPLPTGGYLEQADGTAWMAFYCATMLSMALELARTDPAYEDMASKFFEHFVHITDAMNALGEAGLWDEHDGFYYDEIHLADAEGQREIPLRVRSMVGLLPLIAVEVLEQATIDHLPAFKKRMAWFLENRRDLMGGVAFGTAQQGNVLLALPSRERLVRVLRTMLDENELLSPFGIRSLSKAHEATPYSVWSSTARASASTTSRASRTRGSSAATRTGAAPCGCP